MLVQFFKVNTIKFIKALFSILLSSADEDIHSIICFGTNETSLFVYSKVVFDFFSCYILVEKNITLVERRFFLFISRPFYDFQSLRSYVCPL